MYIKEIKDMIPKTWDKEPKKHCLIEEARKAEMDKPPSMRTNVFFISCPCPKCNPFYF